MANHECTICFKTVSSSSSLRRHVRRAHPESDEANGKSKTAREKSVVCPLCRDALNCYQALVEHLTEAHDLLMKEEAHDFLTTSDFVKWKQQVEKVTESLFVKTRGTSAVKSVRGTKDVYVCHRSGRPRGKDGERIRQPKSQGSQKLDAFCPARMKVVTTEGGRVFLNFLPTHVGHGTDPAHLRLTRSEREMLARKIADKLTLDEILREIHESSEPLGRLKLLSKQDLQNIARDAHLLASVYSHNGDIGEWVARRPVHILTYKPKGAELDSFSPDDFILCFINPRKDLPSEFICLDTYETPSQDELTLFTVSAADENAVLVAVLISNRKDPQILNHFLQKLASKLNLNPRCVFHPRNSHFYAAWKIWFGETTRVVGTWQIEREWRLSLGEMITNKAKKFEIYRAFKSLMESPSEKDFKEMRENINDAAKNESDEFKAYFGGMSTTYEDWVRFKRSPKLTEMNAVFDKLHKTVKSTYSRFKTYETVEVLATSLWEMMDVKRDAAASKALKEIGERHGTAVKTEFTITLEGENLWKVQFQREGGYVVEKADFDCQCRLKCDDCKFCQHAFKCTCSDSAKGNMCKHVHSVCMSLFSEDATVEDHFEELEPEPETFEVIISEAVTSEEVEDGKLELQQDFSQILSMIRTVEDVNLVRNAFRLITPSLGLNKEASSMGRETNENAS